jgi:hypothetical protein
MFFAKKPASLPAIENARPASGSIGEERRDVATVPAVVARAYSVSSLTLRARVLSRLLASVGPLALSVLAGGAFVKYVRHARWSDIPVSIEDAARATYSQVFELVNYVQQSSPDVAEQVLAVLSRDTATMTALGASMAAIAIRQLARRGAPLGERH